MSRILRTPQARDDLIDIWEYLARDSRRAADRLMQLIEEKCQTLAGAPELGQTREDLAPLLRSFPAGRYIIFYRPVQDGIQVIRVLSSYRDIDAQLF